MCTAQSSAAFDQSEMAVPLETITGLLKSDNSPAGNPPSPLTIWLHPLPLLTPLPAASVAAWAGRGQRCWPPMPSAPSPPGQGWATGAWPSLPSGRTGLGHHAISRMPVTDLTHLTWSDVKMEGCRGSLVHAIVHKALNNISYYIPERNRD